MQKLKFNIDIQATKEKVWQTLWNDQSYRQWSKAFCDGSFIVGELKVGNRIHFLAPDGQGMYSDVAELINNEFVSFKHIGMIKENAELPVDDTTKKWTGCYENYNLKESEGKTTLAVSIDSIDEYVDFFNEKFPVALQNIKNLSEAKANAAG